MKKRLAAWLLIISVLFSCLGTVSYAETQYPQEEVEQTLAQLMAQYCGTYWTAGFDGATQCKGFADLVFHTLFGTYGPGPYSGSRYTLPEAEKRHCTCLGSLSPAECNAQNLQALLSQALPGDYVQCVRYTGTQHSMIVVETTDTGITFFDCNLKGSSFCASYTYSWSAAATNLSRGISLYRHDGYVPSEAYRLYFDANGGECELRSKVASVGSPYGALPTPERDGYQFDGWYIREYTSSRTPMEYRVTENSTKTAYSNAYLIAHWIENGSICSVNGHCWEEEATVEPTCEADGYTVEKCSVCGETRNVAFLPAFGHTFELVGTIPATNVEDGTETYQCIHCEKRMTQTILCPLHRFTDLNADAWYYPYVTEMVARSLMNGMSETSFGPDLNVTRAMLVTILYRVEGQPAHGASGFRDVEPNTWYADAVDWAEEQGLVNGYPDQTFRPNAPITREQAATILCRYYKNLLGRSDITRASLADYHDRAQVHSYAIEAMEWANACGILSGFPDSTLRPGGSATRVQIAKMLIVMLENDHAEAGVN